MRRDVGRKGDDPGGDARGQMTVDMATGLVVFISLVVFTAQFIGPTANPLMSSEDRNIEVHSISDRLYYNRLAVENGSAGMLNLSYFYDASGNLRTESSISNDLNLDANGMRVRVLEDLKNSSTVETVELNGEEISIGRSPPDIGAEGREISRVGHTETNGTVLLEVTVW